MSSAAAFRATCPTCRRGFDTEVWRSLHVRRKPEAREELLSGRFGVHTCPWCGSRVRLEPVVLYTDFDRHEWYALYPDWALLRHAHLAGMVEEGFRRNMVELAPPMVQEWSPLFQVRTVFGVPSLREKVLAHELGLDDRQLELWKIRLLRGTGRPLGQGEALWLVGGDAEELRFDHVSSPGPDDQVVVRALVLPRARYVAALCGDELVATSFPGSVVDARALFVGSAPPAAP